jgi:hypothetical protein
MIKPHSKDSVKSRFYASGVLLSQSGGGGDGTSNAELLNVYRSNTIPHLNFSYGAIAFAGNYSASHVDSVGRIKKSFYGYGFNGSASFYVNAGPIDWRVIGFEMVYTHEAGEYLAFRKSEVGLPNIFSAPEADLSTYGIFTEFILRPNKRWNFAYKIFVARTTGQVNQDLYNEPGSAVFGSTFSIGFKQFNLQETLAFGQTHTYMNAAAQLGLTYRF